MNTPIRPALILLQFRWAFICVPSLSYICIHYPWVLVCFMLINAAYPILLDFVNTAYFVSHVIKTLASFLGYPDTGQFWRVVGCRAVRLFRWEGTLRVSTSICGVPSAWDYLEGGLADNQYFEGDFGQPAGPQMENVSSMDQMVDVLSGLVEKL